MTEKHCQLKFFEVYMLYTKTQIWVFRIALKISRGQIVKCRLDIDYHGGKKPKENDRKLALFPNELILF